MADFDIDFEGTGATTKDGNPNGNPNDVVLDDNKNGQDATPLNGGGTDDVTGKDGNKTGETVETKESKAGDTDSSTGELEAGTQIEVDGETYTVADNGDVVDKDGKVIKAAADVKDWLASFEQEEDNTLDIASIQDSLGVEITDENGKAVEFTNDAAGVKAYVNAVLELKSKELQEGAVNKLYSDNPLLKQFQDYVQLTGTARGFGELPDRSGITIDKDNVAQQEAIIRMAASEFGNKSLNDNYLNYLRDTGGLYDEAVNQLKALQEQDKLIRADIEQRAEAARAQEVEELNQYWNKINDVINSGTIAGYKLPTSFVKEVDGKKQTLTPRDFFNYLSRQTEVDAEGNRITAYQRDLMNESEEDYMNRDLLSAWLMYTGGTYKDLIDMAVKEEQVRVLKLKSKQRSTNKTVKFVKAHNSKTSYDDILLG